LEFGSCLINLKLNGQQQGNYRRRFRYEASWALDKEYKKLILHTWKQPLSSDCDWNTITRNLSRCKGDTIHWQKNKGGSLQIAIDSLKTKLNLLQEGEEELAGSEAKMVK
jgi:hypothetical protein